MNHQPRLIYALCAEFADPEQEEAWNEWYDTIHVPALLTVPGFRSARRYQERGAAGRYLAVYEIDSADVFGEPRYAEVTGWGCWAPYITSYSRHLLERRDLGPLLTEPDS